MERLVPSLHPDYHIGDYIEAELSPGYVVRGRITGVAFAHVVFSYIVTLDTPVSVPGWPTPWETISIAGGSIRQVLTHAA